MTLFILVYVFFCVRLDPLKYYSDDCVPMVYPFVLEDDDLLKKLLDKKHFQGHWWSYLLHEMAEDSFEYFNILCNIEASFSDSTSPALLTMYGIFILPH